MMDLPRFFQKILLAVLLLFTTGGVLSIGPLSRANQTHPNSQLYLPIITTPSKCQVIQTTAQTTDSTAQKLLQKFADSVTNGRQFYVSTSGRANGTGTVSDPWDLDSALLQSDRVTGGDIIWVLGGTYKPVKEPIKYNVKISGTTTTPVFVRAYPGALVTIDGGVEFYTDNVTFWGFNITNTNPDRTAAESGSHPGDLDRGGGISVFASNVSIINNIIHEGEDGISASSSAISTLLYGNIIFNNGWQGPDRGHGHGIYIQNDTGTKTAKENVVFNNFGGYSFHIYTENGAIKNFNLSGNVVMNDKFLVGGLQPAANIFITQNFVAMAKMQLGFSSQSNTGLTIQQNMIWDPAETPLQISWWQNATVTNNCILTDTRPVLELTYPANRGTYRWNYNYYQGSSTNGSFLLGNSSLSWSQWKSTTGYDINTEFSTTSFSSPDIFVRPNAYESKRGNIIIFNWRSEPEVNVDISALNLSAGDRYTLHNIQNYFAETISGTYSDSTITIPMTGWTVAKPIGWPDPLKDSTFPKFGVFLLTVP